MNQDSWTTIIKPKSSVLDLNVKEIWSYRDLLWLFVARDIVTVYKQTILGPLWYIIQPLLTTIMFTFVFGRMAQIPTDGIPHVAFYLLGITIWNYFAECLNKTSNTFISNQNIFGKVYFPRVIVPVSIAFSNLGKFFIQFLIFLIVWFFFFTKGVVSPNLTVLLLPVVVVVVAITSLGFGMIFSSLTTKYRDLTFLMTFGVQLWMYVTPVIYPLSSVPKDYARLLQFNPMTSLVESMRYGFLGKGEFSWEGIGYSAGFSVVIFFIGFLMFSRTEKKFMDTV